MFLCPTVLVLNGAEGNDLTIPATSSGRVTRLHHPL